MNCHGMHDPETLEYFGIEDSGTNDQQSLGFRKQL